MSIGTQELEPSSVEFPLHKQGAGSEVEQPELKLVLNWDAGATGGELADHATAVDSVILLVRNCYCWCSCLYLAETVPF